MTTADNGSRAGRDRPGRLLLLAVDGPPPAALRRFVGEGILPACAKLIADSA